MPQFVIQQHHLNQQTHWDLMIEELDHLATWQIDCPPSQWSNLAIPCKKIADHRLRYLSYEGPISNNRGSVRIDDGGDFKIITISPERWILDLNGKKNKGRLELNHFKNDPWQLSFQSNTLGNKGDHE